MCGLAAAIGKISVNKMTALGCMLEDRGTDSVGISYVKDGKIKIAKIAQRASLGLNITLRKEMTLACVSGCMILHTRQATQGSVSDRNAHPFFADGIAFAHNGIILNDDVFGKYEVDSESLIHGIKDRDFSKYEGPIALVWIEDGLLKAFRCGNPLYRGRHNGSTYLASEEDYLKDIGCTHVKELAEGMIYTFTSALSITTEKVKKNKTYGTLYSGTTDYTKDNYGGMGWQGYLDKAYGREPVKSLIPPVCKDASIKEDFRTPSDMVKALDSNNMDYCECCGTLANISVDEFLCADCERWQSDNGVSRDTPPHWLVR